MRVLGVFRVQGFRQAGVVGVGFRLLAAGYRVQFLKEGVAT